MSSDGPLADQPEPAYRRLARGLSDMVLDGELKPGEPMPTERWLCEHFGVNRSSVREGVRLLEEAGLLRRINPKRLVISRPSAEELGQQIERGLLLHEIRFEELWQTASVLEPGTASLAARQRSAADLAALRRNLAATEAALGDGAALAALDLEFHELVAAAVDNRVWQLAREPMARLFYPSFEAVLLRLPEAGRRLLDAHRAIVEALAAKDAPGASQWMERHIRDFRRGFERAGLDFDGPALRPRPGARHRPR